MHDRVPDSSVAVRNLVENNSACMASGDLDTIFWLFFIRLHHSTEVTPNRRAAQQSRLGTRAGTLAWTAEHAITHVSARGPGVDCALCVVHSGIEMARENTLGKATGCHVKRQHERGHGQGGQTSC
jgi:hypothetical protein